MSKERPQSDESPEPDPPKLGGPVLSPYGLVLPTVHALTSGRPKPEPEERWTLGAKPTEDAARPVPTTNQPDKDA